MADQRSRGGKKLGRDAPPGRTEQHEATHLPEAERAVRPPKGEPGGPKPSAGKTRPEHHKDEQPKR